MGEGVEAQVMGVGWGRERGVKEVVEGEVGSGSSKRVGGSREII